MKNIRHLIALMALVLTFGTVQAENLNLLRSRSGKDPWQILQITLYNHHVDTTELSVESPIDSVLLHEILPDLRKAYHVDKESVYLNHSTMLGEVICSFMKVKYAGCKGEIYDYYKLRYSPRQLFVYYLNKYPDSPYAEEMRLKMECIDQSRAWRRCVTMKDYYEVYTTYGTSYCPYNGFSNIAKINNLLRENMALYVNNDSLSEDDDDSMYLEASVYDNINLSLVAPTSRIGHSSFFVCNSGRVSSFTVSFIGSSAINVVLEHGRYQWVELENGEYEIKITASNGDEWWPYGRERVSIEDGLYAACWSDYDNVLMQETLPIELKSEMIHYLVERIISELSNLSKLDYETSRTLLTHYLQKLFFDMDNQEEMDVLCKKYTDKENIEDTIKILSEEFQSYQKHLVTEKL